MTPPTAATEPASKSLGDLTTSTDDAQTISIKLPNPAHPDGAKLLPQTAKDRYERHGIDLTHGYPQWPASTLLYWDEGFAIRNEPWEHVERGKAADPEKKALFGAAKEVRDVTKYIGTEIVGLQLAELTPQQLDELALLIAERVVVFFRDQDLSPRKQKEIAEYFGRLEIHPKAPHVPEVQGVTVMWPKLFGTFLGKSSFRRPPRTTVWHTDLTHELQPAGITHLHNDTVPGVGGDTLWVSGYGAYDKLSKPLQQFLDGKEAVFRSLHPYVNRDDPLSGPKYIERTHPIVRTHPATGWKSLFVNRDFTTRIIGLEPKESDAILNLLFDVYESNLDLQVRLNWKPSKKGLGTSALWDNRVSQHYAVWDYADGSGSDTVDSADTARHGTRTASLAEEPFFDPNSKSQREALGLANP